MQAKFPTPNLQDKGKKARIIHLYAHRRTSREYGVNLLCPTAEGIHVIPFNEIAHCCASGNYATIHYGDGRSLLVAKTLGAVGQCLPHNRFIKTHQSHIVALDQIRRLSRDSMDLADGSRVPVSRANRAMVRKAVESRGVKLG